MISTGQILTAGVLTGIGVAIAAWLVRWRSQWLLFGAIGSFVLIVVWRALSNLWHLNGDFLPAISVADAGCLLFGALAPAVVALTSDVHERLRWVPAVVGGLAGFVVNVFTL